MGNPPPPITGQKRNAINCCNCRNLRLCLGLSSKPMFAKRFLSPLFAMLALQSRCGYAPRRRGRVKGVRVVLIPQTSARAVPVLSRIPRQNPGALAGPPFATARPPEWNHSCLGLTLNCITSTRASSRRFPSNSAASDCISIKTRVASPSGTPRAIAEALHGHPHRRILQRIRHLPTAARQTPVSVTTSPLAPTRTPQDGRYS